MEKAREILLTDPLTFGVMMVKANDADGMVAGACHATADVLRPSLQILKTAPGVKLVSGFFIIDVPDCEYGHNGTFLFADCGLNQDPTAEELAAIADTSAKSFKTLVGGELKEYTLMMNEARELATKRMIAEAEELGADAIVNIRYATSAIMQGAAEVIVYGTAVKFVNK